VRKRIGLVAMAVVGLVVLLAACGPSEASPFPEPVDISGWQSYQIGEEFPTLEEAIIKAPPFSRLELGPSTYVVGECMVVGRPIALVGNGATVILGGGDCLLRYEDEDSTSPGIQSYVEGINFLGQEEIGDLVVVADGAVEFRYCTFGHVRNPDLSASALKFENQSSGLVENCEFSDSIFYGILAEGMTSVRIVASTFSKNAVGVEATDAALVRVEHCELVENIAGVNCYDKARMDVTDTYFIHSYFHGLEYEGQVRGEISDNLIEDGYEGIVLYVEDTGIGISPSVIIKNNVIRGQSYGIFIYREFRVELKDNEFYDVFEDVIHYR
jgi:hypothetical protein